ncbi:GFA family protein [Shimia sp.]|uniref:GFA family protein n=1 Tax=Shimia sp. TaxID=1954381 RepID=UPI003B8BD661
MCINFTGKCLCGAVTYKAAGQPVVVAQCHCEECRRLSGTGHTVGAMYSAENVDVHGQVGVFTYESCKGTTVSKGFCVKCGSPIWGKNTGSPQHITLSLGTMDDARDLAVEVVIFERDKPHWDQLDADVIRFATQPDWTPET